MKDTKQLDLFQWKVVDSIMVHSVIWSKIDELCCRMGISNSKLAVLCGLNQTSFNKSKRSKNGKLHFPSSDTLLKIFLTTGYPIMTEIEKQLTDGVR